MLDEPPSEAEEMITWALGSIPSPMGLPLRSNGRFDFHSWHSFLAKPGMISWDTRMVQLKRVVFRVMRWETWHWLVKYLPILPVWVLYCVRSRSLWFFTASNPNLTFGGFDGENKMEMYDLLPPGSFPKTRYMKAQASLDDVDEAFSAAAFSFPIAVKPAIGRMGLMFRKIDSMNDLVRYHQRMVVDYLLQEFVDYPTEVSIFYYRLPGRPKGTITGFVRKEYLAVTGDGVSTLLDLMSRDPRVALRCKEMRTRHAQHLNLIIPSGEVYPLSHALNLSRGGRLISLENEKDDRLLNVIDDISQRSGFYFGRYDIKCRSIEELKNGRNYSILEFNGSGAEPHHVYGNGNTLIRALAILVRHWDIMFRIAMANHRSGVSYWSFVDGLNHLVRANRHIDLLTRLESQGEEKVTNANKVSAPSVIQPTEPEWNLIK